MLARALLLQPIAARTAGAPLTAKLLGRPAAALRVRNLAAAAGGGAAASTAPRAMETWEEVELHRPRAPTLEGYVRPAGAPEQFDLAREQYHQFMMGKPAKYSVELRTFLMGLGVVSFCLAEFAFTIYKLRPDDLDWVDEERQRAAAAKARIEARLAAQQQKEQQ
eukprot:TRINITY_DN46757_c0_g1_i1.p2 TRINITY_DN46757_c0_g1~~TRINITY_DN46757_c0_g1_i1.p2  ORF type:complete len:165 (-),score=46.80 TRINITY_DN46757_c0_g1_i1:255-749(-)